MDVERIVKELTLEEKASLCSGKDFWHTKAVKRLGIPAVMMCDGPNGLRKQEDVGDHMGIHESIPAVCFPTSSAVAASFDRGLARRIGEVLGNECQAEHVAMLLGPGMNIKRSPLCGRNFEYYSEDPYLSGQMGTAYIQGLESKNVAACVKHFAANNQETRRMNGDAVIDERTLHEIYLASFEPAIREGKPSAVMCAYNKLNGTYAAENKELLTDILREKWGFQGFVVTDWGAVKNRVKGIEAGLDLEMPGGEGSKGNDAAIVEAVKNGTLSQEQLDQAVTRLLRFVSSSAEGRDEGAVFDREADYQAAVEAEKECAVLLKNDGALLPLTKGRKVAFIGGFVEKPRSQGGGSSHINSAHVPAIMDLIAGREDIRYEQGFSLDSEEPDAQLEEKALEAAKASEAVVVFAGLPNRFESEGADRKHLRMPRNQNELISRIARVNPHVAVVLHNGAPVEMPWACSVPAILEMYLGGDGVSEAAMALLYGQANPGGKLAETFPLKLEDNPSYLNFPGQRGTAQYHEGIFVGYRYYDKKNMEVLFPFGHGLSYTSFAWGGLEIDRGQATDQDTVTVCVEVTNTGDRAGKEVVQLYVGQTDAELIRPVKELRAFEKISLNPGETRKVTFALDKMAFACYEPRIGDWYVPSGDYVISVGSSSREIHGSKSIRMEGTRELPLVITEETSIGDLMTIPAAREMFAAMQKKRQSSEMNDETMGEGSKEMAAAMMTEMPLGSLVSFGVMGREQLGGLIAMLNQKAQGR